MDEKTNINQGAGNNADMNFSDELQQIITDNMFWLKRRSKVRQSDLAKGLGISQPTLSQKYSRAIAWTINDLAKAAVFFEVPVSYLVTNNFIEPSSEYQLRGNLATDISHHELAAPSGVRYFRRPDDTDRQGGADARPRFFVMPETNRLALRVPDSSDTFACFFLPANTKNQAHAAPDENTQMTLLAAAVLMRKITVLIDILSIKERP